jgi:serine/threonine protein kinase
MTLTYSNPSINITTNEVGIQRYRSEGTLSAKNNGLDHAGKGQLLLSNSLLTDIADLESLIVHNSAGLSETLEQDINDLEQLLSASNAKSDRSNNRQVSSSPLMQLVTHAKNQPGGQEFSFNLICDQQITHKSKLKNATVTLNLKDLAGSGATGTVFLNCSIMPYGNDDSFVVKLFAADEQEAAAWKTANQEYEISTLTHLQAQAPVKITINNSNYIALVMRQMPGMALSTWLEQERPLSERLAVVVAILKAYKEQVHALGIMHLDIKPDNIFIYQDAITGQWHANFIDYGFSTTRKTNYPINRGSSIYCAYEQFTRAQALDMDWITHNIDFPALSKMITGVLGGNYPLTNAKRYFNKLHEKISAEELLVNYEQLALHANDSLKEAFSQLPSATIEAAAASLLKFQSINPQVRGGIQALDDLATYITVVAGLESLQQVEADFQRAIDLAKQNNDITMKAAAACVKENAVNELKQLIQPTPNVKPQDIKLTEENRRQVFDLINLAKNTRNTFETVYEKIPEPTPEDGRRKIAAIAHYNTAIEKNTSISLHTKESVSALGYFLFLSYTIFCSVLCVAAGFALLNFPGAVIGYAVGVVPGLVGSGIMHSCFFKSPAEIMRSALQDKITKIDFQTQASVMVL